MNMIGNLCTRYIWKKAIITISLIQLLFPNQQKNQMYIEQKTHLDQVAY